MEVAQVVLFKRVGLASLLIAPVLALGIPAQAASLAGVPKVTISGKPAVYKPTSIKAVAHWNGQAGTCTTAVESFTITNNTSATQEILNGTTDLGNLPAHEMTGICINENTQKGVTEHFKLGSNKKAKLTVSVAD
jgi:hypothetical protein